VAPVCPPVAYTEEDFLAKELALLELYPDWTRSWAARLYVVAREGKDGKKPLLALASRRRWGC
jgi:hypothetical protein